MVTTWFELYESLLELLSVIGYHESLFGKCLNGEFMLL